MYEFVEKRISDRYRSDCSATLKKVQTVLLEEYDINTQFTLVGSGARNLITRDGNGPFDLDYNIIILDMPDEYWQNLHKLKETIRCVFNGVEKMNGFQMEKILNRLLPLYFILMILQILNLVLILQYCLKIRMSIIND